MDFSFKKRPVKRLYGEYTILFIFLALCIFGTYLVTGHTFILSKDALNQHLPLLAKYREALVSFFHHPRLNFWSWQMGLGSDTFQVYSYYNGRCGEASQRVFSRSKDYSRLPGN